MPPGEEENFSAHSYTIASALDMLVRRLCRQAVKRVWPKASRLVFCNYLPDKSEDWFVWRSQEGDSASIVPAQPTSWSQWRESARIVRKDSVPKTLLQHTEWILPFALTYPHRLNRQLSAVVDAVIADRANLE